MANQVLGRSLAHWLENLAGALTSVLFPGTCHICDQVLTQASRVPVCCACLSSFPQVAGECCDICGLPWTQPTAPTKKEPLVCRDCQQQRYAFQAARTYGLYQGPLVRAILLLKYERIEPLGSWFAARLVEVFRREAERLAADVVVPVPLHRQRQKERGFNQVDLFARPLAKHLGLPYRPVLLMRKRPRPEKHLLRNEEHWEAVRGAFAIRSGGQVDNVRVLLVDDVMTTGATLDACSRALREAGANSVLGLTLARAARHRIPLATVLGPEGQGDHETTRGS